MHYTVRVYKTDYTTLLLDLNDGSNYETDVVGLHDLPQMEPQISSNARGGYYTGVTVRLPRELTLRVHVNAGERTWPVLNAAHNAARDALIRAFPEGEEVVLRTQYLQTSGTPGVDDLWDAVCIVRQVAWPDRNVPDYEVSLTQLDPTLRHSQGFTQTITLPAGQSSVSANVPSAGSVAGNTANRPTITITPTGTKADSWRYEQEWTYTNPSSSVPLHRYPVAFWPNPSFATLRSQGKIRTDGQDLIVVANDVITPWWYDNPNASSRPVEKFWVLLDVPAGEAVTVRMMYGNPAYTQTGASDIEGPAFDRSLTSNFVWTYNGRFAGRPSFPSGEVFQWTEHNAQTVRSIMVPFRRHLVSPWLQTDTGIMQRINAAGAEIPNPGWVGGYAGMALHHPLGFTSIQALGYTTLEAAKCKFCLRARDAATSVTTDVYQTPTSGFTSMDGFDSGVISIGTSSTPAEAVVCALRSMSEHQVDYNSRIGGADRVYLGIAGAVDPVQTGAEAEVYMLDGYVHNNTTGERIVLFGAIRKVAGVWQSAQIDLENHSVTMAGEPFYYAFSTNLPIRSEWLRLVPGQNSLTVADSGSGGLSVVVGWHGRRW